MGKHPNASYNLPPGQPPLQLEMCLEASELRCKVSYDEMLSGWRERGGKTGEAGDPKKKQQLVIQVFIAQTKSNFAFRPAG